MEVSYPPLYFLFTLFDSSPFWKTAAQQTAWLSSIVRLKKQMTRTKETVAPVATFGNSEEYIPGLECWRPEGCVESCASSLNEMQLTHSCWDVGIWIVPLSLNNRLANTGTPVLFAAGGKRISAPFRQRESISICGGAIGWSHGSGNATQLRSNLIWQLQAVLLCLPSSPAPSIPLFLSWTSSHSPFRVWKPPWIYHN